MAAENGKARDEIEGDTPSVSEFVPTIKLLEQDAADWGPWTVEDERWFQFMTREFGGAPE